MTRFRFSWMRDRTGSALQKQRSHNQIPPLVYASISRLLKPPEMKRYDRMYPSLASKLLGKKGGVPTSDPPASTPLALG